MNIDKLKKLVENNEWYHCWDEKYPTGQLYHCVLNFDGESFGIVKDENDYYIIEEWKELGDFNSMLYSMTYAPDDINYEEVEEAYETIRNMTPDGKFIDYYRKEYYKKLKDYVKKAKKNDLG